MEKNRHIFARYIQIADVLGQMFQNSLEVVIHDFTDLDHAIIHIVNGHISGRALGGPASELNLRRLFEEGEFPDTLVNFRSVNSRGQSLKSSSLAIRDEKNRIIGAFCLHFDMSQFEQFHKFLEFFINPEVNALIGINDFGASLPHDLEIKDEIERYLISIGRIASQLVYKDKQAIVEYLYKRGIFKKKGAIASVANELQLTRQCIYNYIKRQK